MDKLIVYYNDQQKIQIQALRKLHANSRSLFDIDYLIRELKKFLIKNDSYLNNTQVNRDSFLGALRRIKWAYNEYQKTPFDQSGHDQREALMLVFFHNAKCFLEILKRCFPKIKNLPRFLKYVTTIRNFFSHSYEKDFLEGKTVVRIDVNHHFNDGLFVLEIFDLESSEKMYDLLFSLDVFFVELKKIIQELISLDKKKIKSANSA